MQLLLDVPDDYAPTKQVRSNSKRSRDYIHQSEFINKKKKKSKYIKCNLQFFCFLLFSIYVAGANGCKREVSESDPSRSEAIQCCHQNEQFEWIDFEENCSSWLCNYCRIKLGIRIDSIWLCDDHVDIHQENEENFN